MQAIEEQQGNNKHEKPKRKQPHQKGKSSAIDEERNGGFKQFSLGVHYFLAFMRFSTISGTAGRVKEGEIWRCVCVTYFPAFSFVFADTRMCFPFFAVNLHSTQTQTNCALCDQKYTILE